MTDITVTRDGELMVAGVTGETDAGVEFVDAWVPKHGSDMVVVDSGRLVVPEREVADLVAEAQSGHLAVEVEVVR